MSLTTRFLLIAAAIVTVASLASWAVLPQIAGSIVESWAKRMAELQVRHDSARLLQLAEREIALASQLADSPLLQQWMDPTQRDALEADMLGELERFRRNFRDGSYFVARLDDGAYYYEDAKGVLSKEPLRYHLIEDTQRDAWFYEQIAQQRPLRVGVNFDETTGTTKLWVNALVRTDQGIAGIVGTGLELQKLLQDIVDTDHPAVTTLFVNREGAIQLHRDPNIIDYASMVRHDGMRHTLDLLFTSPDDRKRVRRMMRQLTKQPGETTQVLSTRVNFDNQRYLAGITYLPSIDWFEITLINTDELIPMHSFRPLVLALGIVLLLALWLVHQTLYRVIFNPLRALDEAMSRMQCGRPLTEQLPVRNDEIGNLIKHFEHMAHTVQDNTQQLENMVKQRTETLQRLARIDPLTELHNRIGLHERMVEEYARSHRQGTRFGLLLLAVDDFQPISCQDTPRDERLIEIAHQLRRNVRPYDAVGRWADEQFLLLIAACCEEHLGKIAERLHTVVTASAAQPSSVSIGACMVDQQEPVEYSLARIEQALHSARQQGGNCVHLLSS